MPAEVCLECVLPADLVCQHCPSLLPLLLSRVLWSILSLLLLLLFPLCPLRLFAVNSAVPVLLLFNP